MSDCRVALPTGAYHTWKGAVLERTAIEPDQPIKLSIGEINAVYGIDNLTA